MAKLALTFACGDYDRTQALKSGRVQPEGVELNILTLGPEEIFYRMGRFREFDVSEFSLSTYTIRRGRGEPLIAIPVFPSQMFRQDRKSTRLNSSHEWISYAVFCLKKKTEQSSYRL